MGDILAVGVTSGYEKLRRILGDNFLVKDIGDLNDDCSKLDVLGRTFTRVGDEVHLRSSIGYIHGRWEIRRLTRAN